jgi:hypothetical protein
MDDILSETLKFLKPINILNLSLVCRKLYIFSRSEILWEDLYDKHFNVKISVEETYYDKFKRCHLVSKLSVYLKENKLKDIELGQLINLQSLYLSNNNLTTIPKELGQLINCRIIR